ncbi:MAG: hypothetical protein JWN76_3793 [Chitinophagaceae bacterium]|nr:hypothetical protein [Chitinophagaceae bacterium]
MEQNTFKLIGIKPLEGCSKKFLKVLQKNELYFFYKGYTVSSTSEQEEHIILDSNILPEDFFSNGNPYISICAIVGKNGSGKSTLVELLYVGLYNLSRTLRLVDKKDDEDIAYLSEKDIMFELYYCLEGKYYKILFDELHPEIIKFNDDGFGYEYRRRINSILDIGPFYSVVINYSQYSLNTKEIGHWVKSIFHKNDAYQIPIVLNPFRDEGNININRENYLVRSRLLTNICTFFPSNPKLIQLILNNKGPKNFLFEVDFRKVKLKPDGELSLKWSNNYGHRIFPEIFDIFFQDLTFEPRDNYLNRVAKEYVILKLISIVRNYRHYRSYKSFYSKSAKIKLRKYLSALKADKSHVTYKLRQAINFLRFDIFNKEQPKSIVSVLHLSEKISEIFQQSPEVEPMELVPPSFLKVDIEFSNSDDNFSKLSSGEKQKIYSLSSLIYHLKNLDSVHLNPNYKATYTSRKLVQYRYVNLIFDEVELYYHPEFQRTFISELLEAIKNVKLSFINGINILFITHSPFILSDIPKECILFLQMEGDSTVAKNPMVKNTFAANLNDLLATSFFLNEGLIGQFAKEKIQKTIEWCKSENMQNAEFHKRVISLIDEPIIKVKLNEMYAEKMGGNIERARLEAQKQYIDKRLLEIKSNDKN